MFINKFFIQKLVRYGPYRKLFVISIVECLFKLCISNTIKNFYVTNIKLCRAYLQNNYFTTILEQQQICYTQLSVQKNLFRTDKSRIILEKQPVIAYLFS